MKFAAQFMQFMVLIPAAILCFLPMKDQLTSPPKKNHSKDLAGTYHFDSCKCIDFHGRQFPRQLCHASGHRDTLPVLPPLAQYPLGHQRLGIFNGSRTDVLSSKYRALHRLPDSPAGDTALPLSCSDLCTICHQRRICPALLSHL